MTFLSRFLLICSFTSFALLPGFCQLSDSEFSVDDGDEAVKINKDFIPLLTDSGSFNNGVRSGLWNVYGFMASSGSVLRQVNLDSLERYDSLHGTFMFFVKWTGNYSQVGLKIGEWKSYHCYSRKLPFLWKYFSKVNYNNNLKEGWEERFENGALSGKTFFRNGIKDSTQYWYYKDGKIAMLTQYKNGKPEGSTIAFDETGRKTFELIMKNGEVLTRISTLATGEMEIVGQHKSYYENGKIQTEGVYNKASRLDGIFRHYFPTGTLKKEMQYSDGKLNGFYRAYFPNGNLQTEQRYNNGKLWEILGCYSSKQKQLPCGDLKNGTGTVFEYDEKNRVTSKTHYTDGKVDH